jgi:tripartite-type tricarboxylate transporter receptor subunit TctC
MSEDMGQPIIVEPKSGANGAIAASAVSSSAADGYTLLLATPAFATNNAFNKDSKYDPVGDFAMIGVIGETPAVLLVSATSPYHTLKEFVDGSKASGTTVFYGSSGIGSSNHLNAELLKGLVKLNAQHVPYRGDAPVVMDIIGGQIQFAVLNAPGAIPLLKGGKLRALGTATAKRSPSLPDVPTLSEGGVDLVASWFYLVAPSATPKAIIGSLNAALNKAIASPAVRQHLIDQACDPFAGGETPAAAAEMLKRDVARAEQIAKSQ